MREPFYAIVTLSAAFVVALAFAMSSCKQPIEHGAAEAATDGKAIIAGCVWFDGGGDGSDTLAFCDDGRVCVKSGGWHCIQFAKACAPAAPPPPIEEAPDAHP